MKFVFRLEKQAGVYLLATDGRIHPHSVENLETSCPLFDTRKVIHPFAYRVHTHELGTDEFSEEISLHSKTSVNNIFFGSIGKVVAGYRVRTSSKGVQQWELLGKRDPLTPQMFYPIEKNLTVKHGDLLVSRFV